MKLLIWCPLLSEGGGVRLILRLAIALSHQPKVEAIRIALPEHKLDTAQRNSLSEAGINVFDLPSRKFYGDGNLRRIPGTASIKKWLKFVLQRDAKLWLNRKIKAAAEGYDIIYVFWPHSQAPLDATKPMVCTFQDVTLLDYPEILGGFATKHEHSNSLNWIKRCRTVVASSEATKQRMIQIFGSVCQQVKVIHHAVSPEPVHDAAEDPLPITLPQRYILYPANINPHKNHYNLLFAFARFAKRAEVPLVLVGSGTNLIAEPPSEHSPLWWQIDRLRGVIQRTGLKSGTDFFALGYLSNKQLATITEKAWATVMPSLSEGGGSFPAEEALSFGIPLACSDIPVMREHLAARTADIIWFDPQCPASILQALNEMEDRYPQLKERALLGRHDPRPSWENVASDYATVFSDALKE